MRIEKFALQSFDSNVLEDVLRKPYVPPAFVSDGFGKPTAVHEKPDVAVIPAEPMFSETQLKQAEQEAYRRGFIDGAKDGLAQAQNEQAEQTRQLEQVVQALAGRIGSMINQYNRFVAEQQAQLPPIALAIAKKVAGTALDINPTPLVEALVLRCVERLLGEPHIVITVNNRLSDALEEKLIAHFANSNDPGEISIHGDENMSVADCRIEWENGKAERDTDAIWQQMHSIINEMVQARAREAAAPHTTEQVPQTPPATEEGA